MPRSSGPATPARSIEELPEFRRNAMLWRQASTRCYEDIQELLRRASTRPCRTFRPQDAPGQAAVLGDDGRYHLTAGAEILCGGAPRRRRDGTVPHARGYGWWSDGTLFRTYAPAQRAETGAYGSHTVVWTVALLGTCVDPTTVHPRERCPGYVRASFNEQGWPPHINRLTALGRMRGQLVDTFGPGCQGCGHWQAAFVDHEHFSGYVRGLLCMSCNATIDDCPHLSGCHWADYLNNPPAAHLRLLHPGRHTARRDARKKIAAIGLNPYDPPAPFPWGREGPETVMTGNHP